MPTLKKFFGVYYSHFHTGKPNVHFSANFLYENSGDYYLSIDGETPSYNAYFSDLTFWATFGGNMGVATTHNHYSLGLPNPTKKLAH